MHDSFAETPSMDAAFLNAAKRSFGMIAFSPDGTIRSANQAFLDVVGYSQDEITGKHHSISFRRTNNRPPLTPVSGQLLRRARCRLAM